MTKAIALAVIALGLSCPAFAQTTPACDKANNVGRGMRPGLEKLRAVRDNESYPSELRVRSASEVYMLSSDLLAIVKTCDIEDPDQALAYYNRTMDRMGRDLAAMKASAQADVDEDNAARH